MKLVLSTAGFYPEFFGGGQTYVYRLAKALEGHGHLVTVLARGQWKGGPGSLVVDEYCLESIPVVTYRLNPERLTPAERDGGLGNLLSGSLRQILEKLSPELVHLDDTTPALVLLCGELGIPHVVTVHHVGVGCPAGDLLTPQGSVCDRAMGIGVCVPCCCSRRGSGSLAGKLLGKVPRWVYRPVGSRLNRAGGKSLVGRAAMYPWIIEQRVSARRQGLNAVDLFIAPSRTACELLIRNGVDAERIVLEPHGIEALGRQPIPPFDGRLVRFGYVGRIAPDKGLHLIFEALDQLRDVGPFELRIVGKAQETQAQDYLDRLLAGYSGPAAINILGYRAPDELASVLSQIDVLIVPSLVPEAFGLTVVEAFSVGRPVIVSKSGALPELVRDGIDGFVVGRNDSHVLAERMHSLIVNPSSILALADAAPPVRSIEDYADAIERVYDSVMAKGEPAAAHL